MGLCRTCKKFVDYGDTGDCTKDIDKGEDPIPVNPEEDYDCWEEKDG